MTEHPGGSLKLMDAAGTGKDAKDLFDEVDHSNKAIAMLKKYFIGVVAWSLYLLLLDRIINSVFKNTKYY